MADTVTVNVKLFATLKKYLPSGSEEGASVTLPAGSTVLDVIDALKIPPLNVSHHLTVLKIANLIHGEKQGRFVIYSLSEGVLHEVIEAGVPKESLNLGCCQLVLPTDEE